MANTVSILSYTNTFGDWVVNTNALARENNDLAANNYVKGTGTLYLNEPTLGLQVANNAIIAGQLQVQGIGSSAYIQNNLRVDTQVYFQNTTLGLTNSGELISNGRITASGSGTGLAVANNATVGGNMTVSGSGVISTNLTVNGNTTLNGNKVTTSSNTLVANTLHVSGQTNINNKLVVSGNTNVGSYVNVTNDVYANNLKSYNDVLGSTLTISDTATVTNSVTTNTLQSTVSNTATSSATGTSYTKVLQANNTVNTSFASVTNTVFADTVAANTIITAPTTNVTGTGYVNVLQANTSVNTNIVYANSVITPTSSVTGTAYANTFSANIAVVSPKITVTSLVDANAATGYFNNLQTLGQVSVGGNFVINGTTVYNSNTFTINSGSSTGQLSYFTVNRGTSGANATIRWNETDKFFDIRDVASSSHYRIITDQFLSDSVSSANSKNVATSTAVKTVNDSLNTANTFLQANTGVALQTALANTGAANNIIQTQISNLNTYSTGSFVQANASFLQANAAYSRANTSANSFVGTTGTASPSNGALTYAGSFGVTITGSGSTLTVATPQDLRSTSTPTFSNVTLSNALPIASGGTNNTSYTSGQRIVFDGAKFASLANVSQTITGGLSTSNTITSISFDVRSGGITAYTGAKIAIASNQVSGLATSATTDTTNASNITSGTLPNARLSSVPNSALAYSTISGVSLGSNLYTLSLGSYLTGTSFNGSSAVTAAVDATAVNTAGKVVARDASGNFAANQITANLTGNVTGDVSGNAGTVTNGVYTSGSYSNPSWITALANSKITGLAASATTDTTNASNIASGVLGAARLPYSMDQSVATGSNVQHNSLGVGVAASGSAGDIIATGDITAYYSDDRLKTRLGGIENALDKLMQLNGFYYQANETAQSLGYETKREVGVSAQQVQSVLPEVVAPAPIDNQYLTVKYERLVPLLIEAIKELKSEIDDLKSNK